MRGVRTDISETKHLTCAVFTVHCLTLSTVTSKSAWERGFILIRQGFSPVCETLSHTVNKVSLSWLTVLNLAFEKCIISVIFHCYPKSKNEGF